MGNGFNSFALTVVRLVQTLTFSILVAGSLALVGWTVLAALGVWPWLSVDMSVGNTAIHGAYLQIGVMAFAVGLCVFLPANARIMKLEKSHRRFSVDMNDIARAYQISHNADRKGVFALSKEFDSVRERLVHLRNHPDLGDLEPEILDIAAQMSFQSRDLAKIYSEEKVERAYQFLTHRQEEADKMEDRLEAARRTCDELRRWLEDVEAEERIAAKQIERLESDLMELLPSIGYELDGDPNIVKLETNPNKAKRSKASDERPKRLS